MPFGVTPIGVMANPGNSFIFGEIIDEPSFYQIEKANSNSSSDTWQRSFYFAQAIWKKPSTRWRSSKLKKRQIHTVSVTVSSYSS
jgi:hypothetical protein